MENKKLELFEIAVIIYDTELKTTNYYIKSILAKDNQHARDIVITRIDSADRDKIEDSRYEVEILCRPFSE